MGEKEFIQNMNTRIKDKKRGKEIIKEIIWFLRTKTHEFSDWEEVSKTINKNTHLKAYHYEMGISGVKKNLKKLQKQQQKKIRK